MAARTAASPGAPTTKLGQAAYELDDRMIVSPWLRRTMNKVYPDHWSFLLGEIALYSFIVLLLSGTYLTFFFDASMREVAYAGSYAPLRGVNMSAAYDSALRLSFDVRGGLFMRQLHHWAALLFVSSIVVHLLRIFFIGAVAVKRAAIIGKELDGQTCKLPPDLDKAVAASLESWRHDGNVRRLWAG